ncbi:hypothetical protein GFC01_04925 [Desulfofundulus thermobenzoicus]|uniref:Uncharacterized protein n=1 Tax=Desulfofundulus thermobenzoicus TaxID=29376 RepID=A0A6N7IPT8_9FIRM|nr:DUF6062 family protein [Desulfofundulus thermobenzoicus]MQL51613.1 hypothetical protein [Desulfofundulus thermobenzoicus]
MSVAEIERALREQKCPVCLEINNRVELFFRWFDIEYCHEFTMMELLARGGFCPRHGNRIAEIGSKLARTYEYITKERRERMEEVSKLVLAFRENRWRKTFNLLRKSYQKKLKRLLSFETLCPACTTEHEARQFGVMKMADFLKAEANRDQYSNLPALCWTHMSDVLVVSEPEVALFLADCHRKQLARWEKDFAEYFRKMDYRYAHEPKGGEQHAWLKALKFFTGCTDK